VYRKSGFVADIKFS